MNFIYLLRVWKNLGLFTFLSVIHGMVRNLPVRTPLGDRKYLVNPEQATTYHLANSLSKLTKLVQAVPNVESPVILDVGANCGLFSALAAQRFPSARIYAFEPAPDLSLLAKENLKDHGCTVVQKAVADKSGKATLFINKKSQQTNSIIHDAVAAVGEVSGEYEVETISLDDFIRAEGIDKVDVLKIDVQGAESAVLAGAVETLSKTRALIIEVTFLDPGAQEIMQLLTKHFPIWRPIAPVLFGADILLLRDYEDKNVHTPKPV
ncbi:MAG: FkbM family methyltransferase [Candidatus Polarisedimenticolaceae bacterium]|nr:FkbM family methyltransferase [Candidatus Polarisedimenticolaceae bacterium]